MCCDVATTQIRCKSRGNKIESPANFADHAKNLLIVTNIANFAFRNIRTHSHFAIMVVWKFFVHQIAPSMEKLPFEVTERERNFVTFHAQNPPWRRAFGGFPPLSPAICDAFIAGCCESVSFLATAAYARHFGAATAQTVLISTAVSTAYSSPGTAKPSTSSPQA